MRVGENILFAAHRVWFGELSGRDSYPHGHAGLWFEQNDDTDSMISETFGPHLDQVAATDWPLATMPRAAQIGLVLFLDQFPRNLFRRSAKAFAFDPLARAFAHRLAADGVDRFHLIERAFLYLPFEHSEEIRDQDMSVALYQALVGDAPDDQKDIYRNMLDFASKHRAIIDRFGRFPHRNDEFGRETTPEEAIFITENGRGY